MRTWIQEATNSRVSQGFLALSLLVLGGCALGGTGGGTITRNDPAPSGTIVEQGSFELRSGESVAGTAAIYLTDSGTYTIRLEGFTVPSTTGLRVVGKASGTTLYSSSLTATGNVNFSTSVTPPKTWTSVDIVITGELSPNDIYATALFD